MDVLVGGAGTGDGTLDHLREPWWGGGSLSSVVLLRWTGGVPARVRRWCTLPTRPLQLLQLPLLLLLKDWACAQEGRQFRKSTQGALVAP